MLGWVLLLFICGLSLVFAEFFVPGGVCGAIGLCMIVASTILGCYAFPDYVLLIILAEFTGSIVFIVAGFCMMRWLGIGRGMFLDTNLSVDKGWVSSVSDETLVGKTGEVYSALRPVGSIVVDGRRVQAVSTGELIDRGETVQVIEVHGSRIVVERVQAGEVHEQEQHA